MKKLLILICLFPFLVNAQETNKFKTSLKKNLKFATFYGAINGGNSLADDNTYYLNNDGTIGYGVLSTPFDYSLTFGVRKLARLGYENRANVFYDGTEKSFADASTIGRVKGLEFLFEADYKRQQGRKFVDHQHFLRYVAKNWIVKMEYVQDGFADIKYYESSQRYRYNINSKLSFNVGIAQRFSEPYGFNPLETQSYPYTNIALDQGYNYNFDHDQWLNSSGEIVAENSEVWRAIVLPQILDEYVKNEKSLLPNQWNHSLINAGEITMSWKEIFKDDNKYNEKSIIGFCAFLIMVVVMMADIITGWTGKDLVINEAIYNSFVMVVLGCFGIAGLEKFAKHRK